MRRRRQYWYEDLIDSSPKSTAAWAKVLYHLGAWPRVGVCVEIKFRAPHAIDAISSP